MNLFSIAMREPRLVLSVDVMERIDRQQLSRDSGYTGYRIKVSNPISSTRPRDARGCIKAAICCPAGVSYVVSLQLQMPRVLRSGAVLGRYLAADRTPESSLALVDH